MTIYTVKVGAPTDTGPTYPITLNRDSGDALTDWTTATAVVLVLPDGSAKTVTKTSATPAQWLGTVKYNAWWTTVGLYKTHARATFADGTILTCPDEFDFDIENT